LDNLEDEYRWHTKEPFGLGKRAKIWFEFLFPKVKDIELYPISRKEIVTEFFGEKFVCPK
jgi:hypothetical protein